MLKRPQYIAFAAAVLVAVILLNLPSQTAARLKLGLGSVFLPLFGMAGSASKAIEAGGLRATPKGALIAELQQLRAENQELKIKALQTGQVWRENEQLRSALIWQKTAQWHPKLARVITRDPANWWRTLQIDLGSRSGVVTNLPVVTADGLVGKVDQVGFNYSRVVLVGDPNCKVTGAVENKARDCSGAIAPGGSGSDESIVTLTYIQKGSQIQPGQSVVTSGMGGVFPKGIPIGHVIDANLADFGLYLEARVKLSADLKELEYVWVLFP